MDLVPHDVVMGILQRLAPRSLAVSRSPAPPVFFARPSTTGPKISARLEGYVAMPSPIDIPTILDCCNGLLLLDGRVVNPATRQWVSLPPCPALPAPVRGFGCHDACLAFDPTVSPHYEVLLIDSYLCYTTLDEGSEWPPSTFMVPVYSSKTRAWETKPFVREGGAAGTIADVRSAEVPAHRHTAYRRETLYVHCKGDYVMRITLSDSKYQVIKLPAGINASVYDEIYLGRSKKGVYCAVADNNNDDEKRLQVLFLDELGDRIEWIVKYEIDLEAHLYRNRDCIINRPWRLQDDNQHEDCSQGVTAGYDLLWDSDDDNLIDIQDTGEKYRCGYISIFGFHPFKEVVFLCTWDDRVMACHLKSSKIQDLGQVKTEYHGDVIDIAFVYTPYRVGELC
nr:unnamed protein product [Digitaria exilis]